MEPSCSGWGTSGRREGNFSATWVLCCLVLGAWCDATAELAAKYQLEKDKRELLWSLVCGLPVTVPCPCCSGRAAWPLVYLTGQVFSRCCCYSNNLKSSWSLVWRCCRCPTISSQRFLVNRFPKIDTNLCSAGTCQCPVSARTNQRLSSPKTSSPSSLHMGYLPF